MMTATMMEAAMNRTGTVEPKETFLSQFNEMMAQQYTINAKIEELHAKILGAGPAMPYSDEAVTVTYRTKVQLAIDTNLHTLKLLDELMEELA